MSQRIPRVHLVLAQRMAKARFPLGSCYRHEKSQTIYVVLGYSILTSDNDLHILYSEIDEIETENPDTITFSRSFAEFAEQVAPGLHRFTPVQAERVWVAK